jgi:hypothetical protein
LAVAPPADRHEREAQAVAAQVAGGGPPASIHAAGTGPLVQRQREQRDPRDGRRSDQAAQKQPEGKTPTSVNCVCGPDVTAQVKAVLADVMKIFLWWSDDQKEES